MIMAGRHAGRDVETKMYQIHDVFHDDGHLPTIHTNDTISYGIPIAHSQRLVTP